MRSSPRRWNTLPNEISRLQVLARATPSDRMPRLLMVGLCLVCLAAFGFAPQPQGSPAQTLQVASGGGNVWVVTKDPAMVGRWRLLHHNEGMEGAHARVSRILVTRPLALAARGDRVLVALGTGEAPGSGIDLLSLRIQQDPTMGSYYEMPLDSWNVLANIPDTQPFHGLALGPRGPLVLLGPSKQVAKGVKRSASSPQKKASELTTRLLEQRAFAWHELPLPKELELRKALQLLPSVAPASATILSADESGAAWLHQRIDDVWTASSLGIDYRQIERVSAMPTRLGFASEADAAGKIDLSILRGTDRLDVATLDRPGLAWGLGAVGEALLVISSWDPQDESNIGAVRVQQVDVITGIAQPATTWTRLPLDVAEWLHLPLLGLFVVVALLAIVLFRPTEDPELPLTMGVVPMPISRRLLALALDLVPGLILAWLVFGSVAPKGGFALTLWTSDVALSGPGALVIGVTLLHETIFELLWHRSLGKMVFGGVVRSSTGASPSSRAVLLRALFKGVILFAPILGIFSLLSPARQGIPETVSRTVVADRLNERKPSDPE